MRADLEHPTLHIEKIDRGLRDLHADFPLESGVLQEPIEVQGTYVRALRHWIDHDQPTPPKLLPADRVQRLAALDALGVTAAGIGVYPCSASATGIRLCNGTHTPISAMCAVDALAIAALWQSLARLDTQCHACHCPIVFDIGPGSTPRSEEEYPEVSIHLRSRQSGAEQPACSSLCTDIYFLCSRCAVTLPLGACSTLQEAQIIGQQFFAFQHALLRAVPDRVENTL